MKLICILFVVLLTTSFFTDPIEFRYCADLETVTVIPDQPDEEELHLLSSLIFSEAANQPFDGMVAVGNVVLNRVNYLNLSVKEVIFQPGQFDGIHTKWFHSDRLKKKYRVAYGKCQRAAYLALIGYKVVPDCTYYYHNKKIATDTKWVRKLSRKELITISDHTFCHI